MIKKIIKYFLYFLILIFIGILYLSYFGIETKRFNQLIKNEVSKVNKKINIELKDVKILLNLSNFSIALKTYEPNLVFDNKKIKLKNIKTNFSLGSFLKKEFAIKNVSISTKENNLKDVVSLARVYQNSPQLFIFNKMIKNGTLVTDINFNFNDKGKINKDYSIKGSVNDAKFCLLNKQIIKNINLSFDVKDNQYLINDTKFEFNQIKLLSKKIEITNFNKYFLIKGDLKNPESLFNPEVLSIYFRNNFENLGFSNLNFSSDSNFSFKLNKRFKLSDINIKSKINLKKLDYKLNSLKLKSYIPNYDGLFKLNDHKIVLAFNKDQLSFTGKGKFFIDKISDEIDYDILLKDGDYIFKTKIALNNNPLLIKFLNYNKEKNKRSSLELEGLFKKNKSLIFNKILFEEVANKILLEGVSLNENFKINYLKNLELDILNKNEKYNKISLKKNKKNYELNGKVFDATILIEQILASNNNSGVSSIFNDFNSNISVKIDKTYIDKISYINNLSGSINFTKNKINQLNLQSNFSNNKKLALTINTTENNEKVTTLFSGHPKPLVKRYKFIKGFEDGVLDFQSIKKNNTSKSVLIIDNFKVKEIPVLAKLLTLASLQGIADLLTGEGIRFTDFEMTFSNKDKLMTIDEIYAIGPAISIMMSGYIESEKLVSLRGTLVPATTINRTIASIPLIGDILIGKKAGEGVFGVSFKIKGPPKNLKTTVNPIKTLTPRFITRTIEKIKKNN